MKFLLDTIEFHGDLTNQVKVVPLRELARGISCSMGIDGNETATGDRDRVQPTAMVILRQTSPDLPEQ